MKLLSAAVLLFALAVTAQALPNGAPMAACADIFPLGHFAAPNTADTSVSFMISADFPGSNNATYFYCPGQTLNLTLFSNTSLPFRGFLVQARNMMNMPVGSFSNLDALTKLSACTPPESAVTHSSRVQKVSQDFTWTAPPVGTGPIKFLYAVVIAYIPFITPAVNQNYATLETFSILEGAPGSGFCMDNCSNGDIRLVDGQIDSEGRVEICFDGVWGTVCDDLWDNNDAMVVCRQLGFPSEGSLALFFAAFGPGVGDIFLDDVRCSGSEIRLEACRHRGIGSHNCVHREDASVRCRFDVAIVSFVQTLGSVFEGVEDGAVDVCLNVSGRIVEERNYTVTVFGVNEVAGRINISHTGIQCHTIRGVVTSDDILGEDITRGAFTLSLMTTSTSVTLVEPTTIVFILIEETVVLLNFTRPFYEVSESEGMGGVCIRLELPQGGAIGRPVAFRTHIRQLGDRRGSSLPRELFQPRIGYFNIGAMDGDIWCLPISVMDDEEPEPPRLLQVELFVSDVNVMPVRRMVNLTIIDDDIDLTIPTPTEPPVLEAYFTGDTPRVEGDRLYLQVEPNKPASVICRINGITAVQCPPGRESLISPVIPGSYSVRAIVTTTDERIVVDSISVVIPGGNACSAHLINRGVTVEGNSARVEFSGAGLGDGASFVCRVNSGQDQPCTSPLELADLDAGAQRVRITPQCSDPHFTVARFTVV